MKLLTLFVLCVLTFARAQDTIPGFALHDGDRVVFYGDSITQNGGYTRLVEAYARSRFQAWDLRFYNAGVGGDTTKGGGAGEVGLRLERDVISLKPTVVTIMLGMNDGGYGKLAPATLAGFTERLRAMVVKLQGALPGVRIYLIRTSPFDDIARAPEFNPGYNETLRQLGEAVTAIGREQKLGVIDFGQAVNDGIRAVAKDNRELARQILPDRVHPSPSGHLIMGATLLRAWHAPALVARVQLDAQTGKLVATERTQISALSAAPGKIEWSELDEALPLPLNWTDADTELAQMAGARLESLDEEPLVITGLPAGRYEVRIDDSSIGTFTAVDLAGGVNLALLSTPMRWQAYPVRWGAENGQEVQRIRRGLQFAAGNEASLSAAAEVLAGRDESDQRARSLGIKPKPRHYQVILVP